MSQELFFTLMSTGIYLFGAIPYWRDVYHGRTLSHIFSSWIWLILVWFNTYILWKNQEFYAFIPGILMTVSLFMGTIVWYFHMRRISINWFDYFCLILAICGLIYYFFSLNTYYTIILTIIIDILAFLPTIKKWWLQPWSETTIIYFLWWLNQVFTLLAIQGTSTENILFWIYLLIANMSFAIAIIYRRYSLKWWHAIFE
jgi:hypothetical protein